MRNFSSTILFAKNAKNRILKAPLLGHQTQRDSIYGISRFFGTERLEAVVARNAGADAQEMVDAIVSAVRDFAGGIAQADDLTLFVVRRDGLGG